MKHVLALLLCTSVTACFFPQQSGSATAPAPSGASGTGDPSGTSDPNGAPPPSGGTSESTPAAAPAGPVSVDIRSSCGKTMPVFYGEKPGFSSGTFSSIESNSVESHSFQPGEQMWLVDDNRNPISSVTISPGMHELEIESSCASIAAR